MQASDINIDLSNLSKPLIENTMYYDYYNYREHYLTKVTVENINYQPFLQLSNFKSLLRNLQDKLIEINNNLKQQNDFIKKTKYSKDLKDAAETKLHDILQKKFFGNSKLDQLKLIITNQKWLCKEIDNKLIPYFGGVTKVKSDSISSSDSGNTNKKRKISQDDIPYLSKISQSPEY